MYGRNRNFIHQWLDNNKWLAYSPSEDSGYCIPSVPFASSKFNLGQLVNGSIARATTTLTEHAKQATHIHALETMLAARFK